MIITTPKILVIRSNKKELLKLERFLKELFRETGLSAKYFNKVYLCTSEAVINSIVHGNNSIEHKKVNVVIESTADQLLIEVSDEGDGFETEKVDCPIHPLNIREESGRGIHIIRALSDKVVYNDKGNSVQLKITCK